MKILLVVHGFPPENIAGTEVYTNHLAKALSRSHEAFVFYRTADLKKKEYEITCREEDGLKLFAVNNTFRDYTSFESTYQDKWVGEEFGRILDKIQPDVIHVQHLLYLSAKVIWAAKLRKIPVVFTLNDYWLLCPQGQLFKGNEKVCEGTEAVGFECTDCILYQLGIRKNVSCFYAVIRKFAPNWIFQWIKSIYLVFAKILFLRGPQPRGSIQERTRFMRELCGKVDLFLAPSEFIRQRFMAFGVSASKILVSPYGFNTRQIKAREKSPSGVFRFGFIGNLMPAKGAHVLIRSFRALEAERVELKIYGKAFSYKSALGNYVGYLQKEAYGKRNIRFMGGFDNVAIQDIFREIDVLVVPSVWYENAPLVICEAFLTRTLVIASRIGGISELIRDGENGLLFNAGDSEDLKRQLEYVIENREILDRFRFFPNVVKSIEENVQELTQIYKGLVSRRAG